MNVTPKTHAVQVRNAAARKAAVVKDVRRLAYSTSTGDAPKAPEVRWDDPQDDPFCFVCARCTDHFAEHDDLVEQGLAEYREDGTVIDLR